MAVFAQLVLSGRNEQGVPEDGGVASSGDVAPAAGFWLAAAELGFWGCAGTQLNTLGLQEMSAVRGTILLATVNVLTPSLAALIGSELQRQVGARTWLACVLSLCCTLIAVTGDAASAAGAAANGAPSLALSSADACVLGAAVAYATQKVRLGSLVERFPAQRLAAGRLQTQA
eukprot:5559618-Prymnesium_polylepis.1